MATSATYSHHLADWDQIAQAEQATAQAPVNDQVLQSPSEPEEDLDLLIDPCPSFAGLSADLGSPSAFHGNATGALEHIAAALPDLSQQIDDQMQQVMCVTRDIIADIYEKSFHANLPTILDNHLAGVIANIRKMTTDNLCVEVRMTTDDPPALERRLARHRSDDVTLKMIPSSAPGHCTATFAWAEGTIAFDAGILSRGIAEVFADPEVLPVPPTAMKLTAHWDPH